MRHAVLAVVSNCCPPLKGRFLTRYSPVRHQVPIQLAEASIQGTPFDLQVLSTPPAFVLSQDQTLNKMVSKQPQLFKSFIELFVIASFLQLPFRAIDSTAYLATSWLRFLRIVSVWCFLFVTLFNLQGTRRTRRNIAILANFISFVKHFFQKFFDSRSVLLSSNFIKITHLKLFVNTFFRSFLTSFSVVDLAEVVTSATALLEYHPASHLSTPFSRFFSFFKC